LSQFGSDMRKKDRMPLICGHLPHIDDASLVLMAFVLIARPRLGGKERVEEPQVWQNTKSAPNS
jgi:hypothetical protein